MEDSFKSKVGVKLFMEVVGLFFWTAAIRADSTKISLVKLATPRTNYVCVQWSSSLLLASSFFISGPRCILRCDGTCTRSHFPCDTVVHQVLSSNVWWETVSNGRLTNKLSSLCFGSSHGLPSKISLMVFRIWVVINSCSKSPAILFLCHWLLSPWTET